jgi:hypothetical protein
MKIIEVAQFNDDGSVECTALYTPEEATRLLQFAVNFMLAVGNTASIQQSHEGQLDLEFDD